MQCGNVHFLSLAEVFSIFFPIVTPLGKSPNKKAVKVKCLPLRPKDFLIFCIVLFIPHYWALSSCGLKKSLLFSFCAIWHCHLLTFPQRRYSVNRCQDPHQLSNQKSQNPSALSASSAVKKICLPSNVVVGGVNLGNLWLSYLWPIFLCLSRRSFCEGGCLLCLFVTKQISEICG